MKTLLKNLQDLYGMPFSDDPAAAFAVLKDQLGQFPDELSRRALQIILAKQKNQHFPAASVIIQSVQQAAHEADRDQRHAAERQPVKRKNSRQIAETLIRSDMGRTAADQGWIAQLYSFCERNERLPKPGEQSQLMHQARLYEQLYEETKQKLAEARPSKPRSFGSWIALSDANDAVFAHHLRVLEDGLRKREELAQIARGQA